MYTKGLTQSPFFVMELEEKRQQPLAIKREKRIKEWPRHCKISLIEKNNPKWLDLYDKVHY
jgi:predicted GIY-YIG superfamily endonuclease